MRSFMLMVFAMGAMAFSPIRAAEPPGQAEMIQRVIAVSDPCQRRQLMLATAADIHDSRATARLERDGSASSLAALAWQNHLLYVFAGLAEQWDMAAWFTRGTQLAAHTRSGEISPEQLPAQRAAWELEGRQLRTAPVLGLPEGTSCTGPMPKTVKKLSADLSRWIVRWARANGSDGLDI